MDRFTKNTIVFFLVLWLVACAAVMLMLHARAFHEPRKEPAWRVDGKP